jgi:8-oxo-dGTP pyrophosphatase MutT (NUDIX family)
MATATSAADKLWRAGLWMAYRILLVGWFMFRPQRQGVFIGVWYDAKVLVIRNSYRHWYALPAGGVRHDETPAQAARRELREEVGIGVEAADLHFVREIPTTFEFKRDRCSFFEVELHARPEVHVDGREVVWAGFMPPAAALKTPLAPPVREYLEGRPTAGSGS